MQCALILHNIRSIYNVGSLFRTADAAGVIRIYLTGYTPAPIDRFGRQRSDLSKVSLGAEKTVSWKHAARLPPVIRNLKKEGYTILALEQDAHSANLFNFTMPDSVQKIALLAGNEVRGLSLQTLQSADHILEIPMRGKKESLNVSVAAGIALFALLKSR